MEPGNFATKVGYVRPGKIRARLTTDSGMSEQKRRRRAKVADLLFLGAGVAAASLLASPKIPQETLAGHHPPADSREFKTGAEDFLLRQMPGLAREKIQEAILGPEPIVAGYYRAPLDQGATEKYSPMSL